MNKYWFRPHRFGIGAHPSSWEGWALFIGYLLALVVLALAFGVSLSPSAEKPLGFSMIALLMTLGVVVLCWLKTDGGWRWRWGED